MAMGSGADPDLPQCGFRFLVSGTWILGPAKAAVCASLLPNAARCAGGARCCPVLGAGRIGTLLEGASSSAG